jgi:hypothetical protein
VLLIAALYRQSVQEDRAVKAFFEHASETAYAGTDRAVFRSGKTLSATSSGRVCLYVDGEPQDFLGFPYWHCANVYLAPGHHRLVVEAGEYTMGKDPVFAQLEVDALPFHAYRLERVQNTSAHVFQLWDETAGASTRTLCQEYNPPPTAQGVPDAVRKFEIVPGSALLLLNEPLQQSAWTSMFAPEIRLGLDNHVRSPNPNRPEGNYPYELPGNEPNFRFVPAGSNQLTLYARWAGADFSARDFKVSLEADFQALHIYRVFARKRPFSPTLIQVWDETKGTGQRVLVKEFRV